jgi:signal transduction histidine kinase
VRCLDEARPGASAPVGGGAARGPRSLRAWAGPLAVWVLPLAYLAWRFSSPAPARQTLARVALLAPIALLPALAAWIAGGSRAGRERLGWRLLGAAWGAMAARLAATALLFAGVGLPSVANRLSQSLALAFFPLAFSGFLALASIPRNGLRLGRLVLDAALTVTAVHALAWYFVLRHTASRTDMGLHLPALALDYAGELLVLLAALIALHRHPGEPAEAGMRLVVLGQFLLTLSGLASVQAALAPGPYNAAVRFGTFAAASAFTASGALLSLRRRTVLRGSGSELAASIAGLLVLRAGLARRALEVELAARSAHEERLQQGQRLEALGHMAAAVAHDFNNILAALQAAASELERRSPGSPELDDIHACTDRGAALCRQLVGLARKAPQAPHPVDVRSVPEGLSRIVRRLLPPEVLLSVDVPPGPVLAVADPSQLEIAVLNLAVNARDAMPSGGRLEIAVDVVDLPAPAGRASRDAPPARWARLSVRDTGTGMDAETLARAREPFFTTKGDGRGTGLGLSTVDAIASALGGRLVIESTAGEGTRVSVLLPVA